MDDSVTSGSKLAVSVSFGRFENDALSWEKWSSFSPNKYLEEVGNLSTPGSVAQKKAYFEAHYKKIAAKKAEELEQEKSAGSFIPCLNLSSKEDCPANSTESGDKFDSPDGEKLLEEIVTVQTNVAVSSASKDDENDRSNGFVDVINSDGEREDVSAVVKCESLEIEEIQDEWNIGINEPVLNVEKGTVPVGLETHKKDSKGIVEKCATRKNGREPKTSVLKKENSKSSARNITQKVTPNKSEKNAVMKKKIVSPVTKPLQTSTTRYSKPTSTSTPISTPQSVKKRSNGHQLPKSNEFSIRESKKDDATSLHMSLSLGPANSLGELSMTRKSLIMERMGDKDIVKRAFKTFQNRTDGSPADEISSAVKHVSSIALEPKVSSFHTPTKGNVGPRKNTKKTDTPGTKSNPLPSGSHRSSAPSRKDTTAVSSVNGLRSDGKSEKRKEFLKKLEAKSIAREAANAQITAKSRMGVANEIHQRPTLSR